MNNIVSYLKYRTLARVLHAETAIKHGLYLQKEIEQALRSVPVEEGFDQVYGEYPIPLTTGTRKHHKVDILCFDEALKLVHAFNCKGTSFNCTRSKDRLLDEYEFYRDSIKEQFPSYFVTYNILKLEYDPESPKSGYYNYLNENGISVYNTKTFLEIYGIELDDLSQRVEDRVVANIENKLRELGLERFISE